MDLLQEIIVVACLILIITSACVTSANNLEISNVNFKPGEQWGKSSDYDISILTFDINNKDPNTKSLSYSVYARVYDKSGIFVAKSIPSSGFSLEPGESRNEKLMFGDIVSSRNINFNNVSIGKIDIVFEYLDNNYRSAGQFIYTKKY